MDLLNPVTLNPRGMINSVELQCPATFSPPELAVSTAVACDSSQTNQINTDSFNITGCRNAPSSDPHSLFICFYRLIQRSVPSITWLFIFQTRFWQPHRIQSNVCFDFPSFFWFQLSPAGTVWPVRCQTLPRVYHIAANCLFWCWMSRVEKVYQRFSADNCCLLSLERTRRGDGCNPERRKMLQWFWELRKVTTCVKILLVLTLELSIFIMCFYTAKVCGACNSLTAAVFFPVHTDQGSVLEGIPHTPTPLHPHTVQNPLLLLEKKMGRSCFSLRHRCPEWLQLTGLYSFHCEPIIAVMLISLFNYSAGSHGRAIIKRKSAKMNRVRVPRLNTVTSALWENTWELDSG